MTHRKTCWTAFFLIACLLGLPGCESASYYWQAGTGHLGLMRKRVAIDDLLASDSLDPERRRQLQQAVAIRQYAGRELDLPVGGSYQHWVEIPGDAVTWNVFAAQPLSMELLTWCFPVAGCVSYRGYFEEARARAFADAQAGKGYDVYVGGASAYSTLGWFDDPLLSTFIRFGDVRLASLLFHELAHQVVYVKGDTTFNESFASAVEALGVEQWLLDSGRADELAAYYRRRDDFEVFSGWLLEQREQLRAIYQADLSDAQKQRAKAARFRAMKEEDYPRFRERQGNRGTFDGWMQGAQNNARLLSLASYNDWVGAFTQLFRQQDCDWSAFYARVEELAGLTAERRREALAALQSSTPLDGCAVPG